RCRYGAPGKQLGGSDQKELARVLQDRYSGRLHRTRDRLRHRATALGGDRRDRHPANGAGPVTWTRRSAPPPLGGVKRCERVRCRIGRMTARLRPWPSATRAPFLLAASRALGYAAWAS